MTRRVDGSLVYREPTATMRTKFNRMFEKLSRIVNDTKPESIAEQEPGDGTHFRDTDIGSRIEWTDGKMYYWIIFEARRLQDNEFPNG